MFVDASAVIAILTDEPGSEDFAKAIDEAPEPISSVLAIWEATVGLFRKKKMSMDEAEAHMEAFVRTAGIVVLPITDRERQIALRAFDLYGRHRYPDADRNRALNLADCFHYATAMNRGVPILSKDDGFALTDASVTLVKI